VGVVRTFRATVSYDGTDFSGWQVQGDRRTVQGVLQEALSKVLGAPVTLMAAGRTDAGVHAEGQVVSFRAQTRIPPAGIAAAANVLLPGDVAVLDLARVPTSFHATYGAKGKVYRYEILSGRTRRPLLRRTTWRVASPLDLRRMRAAARHLVGRRDFRSFRTNPGVEDRGTTVRNLRRLDIRRRGDRVLLEFEGDGFLYNMVRAMVGTLVQVGRGTWTPGRVEEALRARDRRAAGPTAPPQGLTLVSVSYAENGERLRNPASRPLRIRPEAKP
jgi:tRNA pseudouridine38-40 synthase